MLDFKYHIICKDILLALNIVKIKIIYYNNIRNKIVIMFEIF